MLNEIEEEKDRINSNKFKKIYQEYNKSNSNGESDLLKFMINELMFFVVFSEDTNGIDVEIFQNKKILKIYTSIEDMQLNSIVTVAKFDFKPVLAIVNENCLDEVWINSKTDNFIIKHAQICDLQRQIEYKNKDELFSLNKNNQELERPAFKVEEIDDSKTQICKYYEQYKNNPIEKNLDLVYNELISDIKFYTPVLPKENAELDSNNHPIIDETRVLHNKLDGNKGFFSLYISKNDIIKANLQNEYFSAFTFDDYISIIDNRWGHIDGLKVVGDSEFDIPIELLNKWKIKKDRALSQKQEKNHKDNIIWETRNGLKFVSDDSLNLAFNLLKKADVSIKEESSPDITIINNIVNLCNKDYTTEKLLQLAIESDELLVDKNKEFKFKAEMTDEEGGYEIPIDNVCYGCNFQKCPKRLIGYIVYLQETNQLEEKLAERKEYRENNQINDFFTFNWNYGDVLRIIPDDWYDFCYNCAKNGFVFVNNSLKEGEKSILIRSLLNKVDYKKVDYKKSESNLIEKMKNISKDIPMKGWGIYYAKPEDNIELWKLLEYDKHYIIISAIIYYLLKSNREDILLNERKYYKEHKEEMDNRFEEEKNKLRLYNINCLLGSIEKWIENELPEDFKNYYTQKQNTFGNIRFMDLKLIKSIASGDYYDREYKFKPRKIVPFIDCGNKYICINFEESDKKNLRQIVCYDIIKTTYSSEFKEYIDATLQIIDDNFHDFIEKIKYKNLNNDELIDYLLSKKDIRKITNKELESVKKSDYSTKDWEVRALELFILHTIATKYSQGNECSLNNCCHNILFSYNALKNTGNDALKLFDDIINCFPKEHPIVGIYEELVNDGITLEKLKNILNSMELFCNTREEMIFSSLGLVKDEQNLEDLALRIYIWWHICRGNGLKDYEFNSEKYINEKYIFDIEKNQYDMIEDKK